MEFYDAHAAATRREDVARSVAPCILTGLAVLRGTLLASERLIDKMRSPARLSRRPKAVARRTAAPVGNGRGANVAVSGSGGS